MVPVRLQRALRHLARVMSYRQFRQFRRRDLVPPCFSWSILGRFQSQELPPPPHIRVGDEDYVISGVC